MKGFLNLIKLVSKKITIWRYLVFTVICFVGFFVFLFLGGVFEKQDFHVVFFIISIACLVSFALSTWLGVAYLSLYYFPFKSNFFLPRRILIFLVGILVVFLPVGVIYVVNCTGDNFSQICYLLEPFVFPYRVLEFVSR
jgi:hypothetical protein